MYRLENPIQHYSWGSTSALPDFLGIPPDGRPYAELWMGAHPLAPSLVREDGARHSDRHGDRHGDRHERGRPLDAVVGADELPYLFKVLTASRPLSLQVHPHAEMARAGFEDEESRGVPLDGPGRAFKDPHHKPELAYALTPFESLVGLRPTAELWDILPAVGAPLTTGLAERLRSDPGFAGIVRLLGVLLAEDEPVSPAEVGQVVDACAGQLDRGIDPGRAFSTVVDVAAWHPYDPAVVATLLLNRVTLQPGEAAYLAHGIVHAHLSGTCLEIMACSDNVLRAGLTGKHLQRGAFLDCVREGMSDTFRIEPKTVGDSAMFLPPVEEFALSVTRRGATSVEPSPVPGSGPRTVLCLEGEVELRAGGSTLGLRRGESVFVPGDAGVLTTTGSGTVAQAYTP